MQSSPFPSHIALLLMVLLHIRKESNPPAFPSWMDPAGKFDAHVHHHHAARAFMFVEDQSSLSLFHTMPDAQQCFDTPAEILSLCLLLCLFWCWESKRLTHWSYSIECNVMEPDRHVLSWNTVFRGSAMHWCGREALWHFEQMHEEHVETGIAWLSLLVCEHIAKVWRHVHFFEFAGSICNIFLQQWNTRLTWLIFLAVQVISRMQR